MIMETLTILTKQDLNEKFFVNKEQLGQGSISIAISEAKGNLLRMEEDGLYVGNSANATTAHLYVSNDGDDTATGSRTNPLRTIREAFSRQKPFSNFTIWLNEGQVHEWRSSWEGVSENKNFTFCTYGETVDMASIQDLTGGQFTYKSNAVSRATIKFICDKVIEADKTYARPRVYAEMPNTNAMNSFYGIVLDTTTAEPAGSEVSKDFVGYIGTPYGGQNLLFSGCSFVLRENVGLVQVGRDSRIILDSCQINSTSNVILGNIHTGGKITLLVTGSSQTEGTAYPGNPDLMMRETPADTVWQNLFARPTLGYTKFTLE